MRIINIIEIKSGILSQVLSWQIYEDQFSADILEEVREKFSEMVTADLNSKNITDEEEVQIGFLNDDNTEIYSVEDYYLFIHWSDLQN